MAAEASWTPSSSHCARSWPSTLDLRAEALVYLAHVHMLLSDPDAAEVYLNRFRELDVAGDAVEGVFHAIRLHVAVHSGRMEHAAEYSDEALSHAERPNVTPFHRVAILAYCGLVHASNGEVAEAKALFARALSHSEDPDAAHMRGYTLFMFGRALAAAHDFNAAAETTDQAIQLMEPAPERTVMLGALTLRAQAAEQLGDMSGARSFYARALRMVRARGYKPGRTACQR